VVSIGFGLALDFWSNKRPLSQHLEQYVRLLRIAEDLGFNSVWAGENRPVVPQPGHTPSPLLVLAALANRTGLRLGTGVTLLTLWQPLRLAYDGALLDQLSDGRLTLGIGVGAAPVMKRYGVPPESAGSRTDDTLKLLKALWSGADHYHGEHFRVDGGVVPGPVQPGGPPIWVGGTVQRSVERAADLGDAWYGATQYHFELIRRQASRYRDALKARGADPSGATVAINRTAFLAPSVEQARREGGPYVTEVLKFYAAFGAITDAAGVPLDPKSDLFERVGDEIVFVGTPATCTDSIQRYVDAGVTQFNLRVSMGDMPAEFVERTIRLLGEQVLPKFR
jgi:alkanesulfonate monooxygenase SsuD/methylene tetrahydromethanopterin reductase-like flavin-dependent oxidoreductase (luciferase family)